MFYGAYVVFGKRSVACLGGFLDLVRPPGAYDSGGHLGPPEHPGNGQLGKRQVVALGDGLQTIDQGEVRVEGRRPELDVPAPPVVCSQPGKAGFGEFAGQKTAYHRAVDDHADVIFGAVRQQGILDAAPQHAVGRLERRYRVNGLHGLQVLHREVGYAGIANLPFLDHFGDLGPCFLNFSGRIGPVNLVQVDHVRFEALQARFAFLAYAAGLQAPVDSAVLFPVGSAFRGQKHLVPAARNSLPHDFFGMPKAVDTGCVYPVDTHVESTANGSDGLLVFLGAPAVLPVAAADGPGAEADAGELFSGISEGACVERHGAGVLLQTGYFRRAAYSLRSLATLGAMTMRQ